MAIDIEVRDYNSEVALEECCSCAYGNIRYTEHDHEVYVKEPDSDGDAYFSINDFGWWIGCQYAIKLKWDDGQEVILKASKNCILKKDKETQKQILDYFRKLIANKFKYTPFDEPALKLELSGAESEFMDI